MRLKRNKENHKKTRESKKKVGVLARSYFKRSRKEEIDQKKNVKISWITKNKSTILIIVRQPKNKVSIV